MTPRDPVQAGSVREQSDRSAVLSVRDLTVTIDTPHGAVHAVESVSLELPRGTRLGIVGESGSGKSLTALAVMGLLRDPLRVSHGSITVCGQELVGLSESERARLRGRRLGMVYQDPMSSLNPVFTVGRQIVEGIRLHSSVSKAAARRTAEALLADVGIPDPTRRFEAYPHELSGGMRQRVMLAMALSSDPDVLIADEPTTALDVTTQARILEHLRQLSADRGLAVVLVTHDLGVAAGFCDELAVMYAGRIVEHGAADALCSRPRHPYTAALLRSRCAIDADVTRELDVIPGRQPLPAQRPTGCNFSPRCHRALEVCGSRTPPAVTGPTPDRWAACFNPEEIS